MVEPSNNLVPPVAGVATMAGTTSAPGRVFTGPIVRDGATDGPLFWNATWREFYRLKRLRIDRYNDLWNVRARALLSNFNVSFTYEVSPNSWAPQSEFFGKPTCWCEAPPGIAKTMGQSDVCAFFGTLWVSHRLAVALHGLYAELDKVIKSEFPELPKPGPCGLTFEQVNEFVTQYGFKP